MTTVELFHRIGRRARGGDFTKLALTEQGDIIEAANTALQSVYNLLPAYFKEITEGFALPAPALTTLAMEQYSQEVSTDAFTTAQFGRTIVIAGDPAWNQIVGTNRLLNPYMGQTGDQAATIYGDAVYSDRYPFERVIGNPKLANQQGAMINPELQRVNGGPGWFYQQSLGVPNIWWPQYLGNSQGNEPLLVLRFSPAPSIAFAINVKLSYWPKRLTLFDYQAATTIPVPDQFLEMCVMPIALEALMSTPIWDTRNDDANISLRAEAARVTAKNQPVTASSPNNRIFTPVGY